MDKSLDPVSLAAMRSYAQSVCSEDFVEELLSVVREFAQDDLPLYTDALRTAFSKVEPVFARRRYAEFCWHCAVNVPDWMASVVLANGKGESEGSEKLLELWRHVRGGTEAEEQIMAHARDESRHSRIFVRMTEMAFPGCFEPEAIRRYEESLPDVRGKAHQKAKQPIPESHVIDHLAQMNIGEIRTRLHMHLFAPIVHGDAPAESKRPVRRLLRGLVKDEVRHIGYTAKLMEEWARDRSATFITDLYVGRLNTFNKITVEQTETAVRDYGQGRFPDLLEI